MDHALHFRVQGQDTSLLKLHIPPFHHVTRIHAEYQ